MKKFFTIMLFAVAFCACSNDDSEPVIDYANLLVGQWVYDHPEEGIWETIKFTSSGMLYFSNSNDNIYEFENENVNGRYFVDGNKVTGTYQLNETIQMNLDMQIIKINELEFTARFNDSGLTFTYARLLESQTLDPQETVYPDYDQLLRGVEVVSYVSHNAKVAIVDRISGSIMAVSPGRTYIDAVTSEGTAVIEIIVEGMLPYRFDKFIGADRVVIYETFGNAIISEDENLIIYQSPITEIQYMGFEFNESTGKVAAIALLLSDVDSTYIDSMTQYFEKIYTVYEKGTTETSKAYINNENFADATVGIVWNLSDLVITYVTLEGN